jgi:hypothetical protein
MKNEKNIVLVLLLNTINLPVLIEFVRVHSNFKKFKLFKLAGVLLIEMGIDTNLTLFNDVCLYFKYDYFYKLVSNFLLTIR